MDFRKKQLSCAKVQLTCRKATVMWRNNFYQVLLVDLVENYILM